MRWPLLSALLLPLPFAALPLVVLVTTGSSPAPVPPETPAARVVLTTVTVPSADLPDEAEARVATADHPCSDHTSALRRGT